jgi:hypothetical protein
MAGVKDWSPEVVDRALMIACAAVWLLALGFWVAAGVALVNLGSSHAAAVAGEESGSNWVLYTVIAVSAVVIIAAVPLLLRARNATPAPAPVAASPTSARARLAASRIHAGYPAATSARSAASGVSTELLDRLMLRCGLGVLTAMGLGYIAVGIATHLMAVDSNGASWALYGVAALFLVGMVAVPVLLLKQLPSKDEE